MSERGGKRLLENEPSDDRERYRGESVARHLVRRMDLARSPAERRRQCHPPPALCHWAATSPCG